MINGVILRRCATRSLRYDIWCLDIRVVCTMRGSMPTVIFPFHLNNISQIHNISRQILHTGIEKFVYVTFQKVYSEYINTYRLTETVVTPFRRNSTYNSSSRRRKFNKYFSRFRVRIEHCFGILKERFSSLKELRVRVKDISSHKFVCSWIMACCILHNILIPHLEAEDYIFESESDSEEDDTTANGYQDEISGDLKRQALFSVVMGKLGK